MSRQAHRHPVARRPRRWGRWVTTFPVLLLGVAALVIVACVRPLAAPADVPFSSRGAFGGHPVSARWSLLHPTVRPPDGWAVLRTSSQGDPLIATHVLHPDPTHPRAFAAAAWLSPLDLRFELIPGTAQPGGRWSTDGQVPVGQRRSLAAVFNAGFKFSDIDGGFRADGRTAVPLRRGEASLAITTSGTATVGAWGTEIVDHRDVVAVRQNLHLIVDHGRAAAGLLTRHDGWWSTKHHQVEHTWRSGIGERADGSLVYIGGADLDLQQLADAFVSVHAERAMQLDIHPHMIVFHLFQPAVGPAPAPGPARPLLNLMTTPMNRYLVPDRRDFIAVFQR